MLFFKNKILDFSIIGVIAASIIAVSFYFVFKDEIIYRKKRNNNFFRPDLSKENRKKLNKINDDEVIRMNTALMNIDDEYRTYYIDEYGNIIVDGKIIGQKKDNENGAIAILKNGNSIQLDTINNLLKSSDINKSKKNMIVSESKQNNLAKRKKIELVKKNGKSSFLPSNFSVDNKGNVIDKNGKIINTLSKDVVYFINKNGEKVFLNKNLYSFNQTKRKKIIPKPKPKPKPQIKPVINTEVFITDKDLIFEKPTQKKNKLNNLYKAIIYTNQKIIHNQEVKILLLEDIKHKDQIVYKNSVLYGIATINGSRYSIEIKRSVYNLKNNPIFNAVVYDRNYIEGIFASTLEDEVKQEASNQVIDNTSQEISNYNSYLGALLNTSKETVKKKKKLEDLALNVVDDYPIYIKIDD